MMYTSVPSINSSGDNGKHIYIDGTIYCPTPPYTESSCQEAGSVSQVPESSEGSVDRSTMTLIMGEALGDERLRGVGVQTDGERCSDVMLGG